MSGWPKPVRILVRVLVGFVALVLILAAGVAISIMVDQHQQALQPNQCREIDDAVTPYAVIHEVEEHVNGDDRVIEAGGRPGIQSRHHVAVAPDRRPAALFDGCFAGVDSIDLVTTTSESPSEPPLAATGVQEPQWCDGAGRRADDVEQAPKAHGVERLVLATTPVLKVPFVPERDGLIDAEPAVL